MAETVTLPVRGWSRIAVLAVFTSTGVATSALVGGLAGLALGSIPDPGPWVVALAVGLTGVADLVGVTPVAIGRQVPLEWGRWFSAPTAAGLYGARLGVGPLTVLMSWTWWTATVLAGVHGLGVGALAGAVFHLARVTVMVAGVAGATSAPARAALLGRLDRPVRVGGIGATVAVAGLVLL